MKPELFNTAMVNAILAGRESVTRRLIKPQPKYCVLSKAGLVTSDEPIELIDGLIAAKGATVRKARYQKGDILYVRETWALEPGSDKNSPVYIFKAGQTREKLAELKNKDVRWYPSIHMPMKAARIFLRVADVRVERLKNISYDEAIREGADPGRALNNFMWIWNKTVSPSELRVFGWDADPWVYAVSFERISREEARKTGDEELRSSLWNENV